MNIHVTHGSDKTLSFAAEELRAYLGRMLPGDGPDISICLKAEPVPDLGANDAFAVDLTVLGGTITGNSARAVLLGVYDLLHTLGCRFLAPGRDNERVPEITREALRVRSAKTASFFHRGVCIEGADSRENILEFIDWLPKVGYNSFFLQFKSPYAFLARWYHHENNPLIPPQDYTPADAMADMAVIEGEIKRRGLMLHKVGHGWTGEVLGYETLSWDPVEETLSEDRNPYAAMLGGERGLYLGMPANTNLCLSAPRAIDLFADLVLQYARENPDVDYLHIWLADEYNNVCECEACRKTTVSDQYVALLNEIDCRLTEEGLDTKLVFLLYQELLWPPVKARLEHPERFVLMFAPISRTFERSYELRDETVDLPPYVRNRITLPTGLDENVAFLRGWQAGFSGDSFAYDYPLGRAHYGDFGYVHIAKVIHGDIQRLEKLGLQGIISCQELRAGMPNFLPNYVMGRTLLERDADIDELIDEYFTAAYGERAREAGEFLKGLSERACCDYLNGKGPRTNGHVAQAMEEAAALCERFLEAAPDGSSGGFWDRLCCHARYAGRMAQALACLARGEERAARESWERMRDFICQSELAYQPWLDVYRVLEVTQKYTGLGPAIE